MDIFTDAEDAKNALSDEIASQTIDQFATGIDTIIYGVEAEGRNCGDEPGMISFFNDGTLVMFFNPDDLAVVGGVEYAAGVRYMVTRDPEEGLCIFIGSRLPTQAPMTTTTTPPQTTTAPPSTTTSRPTPPGPRPPNSPRPSPSPSPSPSTDAPLEPGETPEMSQSPDGPGEDDGTVCFPADATVVLEDGSVKTMALLQLGDRVKVAVDTFSDVFMFTHKNAATVHRFVEIHTEAGIALSLTKGHYMYINGGIAAASTVKVSDIVELGSGETTVVSGVSEVSKVGLYNPQTVHGDIIVNSIRATTYTRVVEPPAAQALMAPLRLMYGSFGWCARFLDSGADSIAQLLPQGQATL